MERLTAVDAVRTSVAVFTRWFWRLSALQLLRKPRRIAYQRDVCVKRVWYGCWVPPDNPQEAKRRQPWLSHRLQDLHFRRAREKDGVPRPGNCVGCRLCPRGQSEDKKRSEWVCDDYACHAFGLLLIVATNTKIPTGGHHKRRTWRAATLVRRDQLQGILRFWNTVNNKKILCR